MALEPENTLTLSQAVASYISTLSPQNRQAGQIEVNRFVRWYGSDRLVRNLTPRDVESYVENLGTTVIEVEKRIEPLRAFFFYARKEGLVTTNLAASIRIRRSGARSQQPLAGAATEAVLLTREGLAQLEADLATLKAERPKIAQSLRLAMADKDFRENAPLDAAREYQGQVEARIRGLEAVLRRAQVVDSSEGAITSGGGAVVTLGCTVVLTEMSSGEQMRYTLVHPNEASLAKGKISVASPTGKALLDRHPADVVEVLAPAGVISYRIDTIEL